MDDMQVESLERFTFGDGPELADELLALVLEGRKTATCWAARDGELTHPGKRMVACDSQGRPRAVLETVALERRRFWDVDDAFARAEGEGDLSLACWRAAHRAYFERNGGFSEDMELWCERFRLVRTLRAEP
jgi:uncharacterized protein YhfF